MTKIRPVLKKLHSPDVDLEIYEPTNPRCFCLLIQAMFGPENSSGEESFDMLICTPDWLNGELRRQSIINGRNYLIVDGFDLSKIRAFLVDYASKCIGETWQDVATKLSRIGKWEFEDYAP